MKSHIDPTIIPIKTKEKENYASNSEHKTIAVVVYVTRSHSSLSLIKNC